jgi:hypothetical protein
VGPIAANPSAHASIDPRGRFNGLKERSRLVRSIGEQERPSFCSSPTAPRRSRDGANDISASEDPDRPVIVTHHR